MKLLNVTVAAMLMGSMMMISADASVDAQITQIVQAQAQERVRLMNQFKMRLAEMNAEDREAALSALQTKIQTRTQTREQIRNEEGEGDQLRIQTRQQERIQDMNQQDQMNQMQQQHQMQQMQQHQMGNMQQMMDAQGTQAQPAAGR